MTTRAKKRGPGRPSTPGLTKELVLHEACLLAEERGMDNLNLKELAERLGIQPPSLYNHIKNLEELKEKIAIVAVERLNEAMEKAILGRSGEQALREMIRAYRNFAQKNPELYGTTQRVLDSSDLFKEKAAAVVETISILFEGLSREERIHRIRTLRSLLHGFVELERTGGFGLPEKINVTFERIVELSVMLLPGREGSWPGRS